MQFQWDPEKAASNLTRHGVSFDEASTVFGEPLATTVRDPHHSVRDDRWLTTGRSAGHRVLLLWHTNRNDTIRIIGAREATAS